MNNHQLTIEPIAHIITDFDKKFGIPRQSGIVKELSGKIVFEKEYRNDDALRGIDGFSHLWLIWGFCENDSTEFTPTVRPPRLGGNAKMGVFATRSPYRPNGLGLSLVELKSVEHTDYGSTLVVCGADMVSGTPIYDIKPYLPYIESKPEAKGGFGEKVKEHQLKVNFPKSLLDILPPDKRMAATKILAQDIRPSYQNDSDRAYGVSFSGFNIKFKVEDNTLTVFEVKKR